MNGPIVFIIVENINRINLAEPTTKRTPALNISKRLGKNISTYKRGGM